MAMMASGCMWSTWVKGTKPCSGVSIEAARGLRLKVQCGRKPTMRSSSSTPLIDALQRFQLVQVERGETVELDRAEVAAGALDPEHLDRLAGERIGFHDLGRGVAAAEVGDALVGAEQVGAVEQLARLIEAGRVSIIPTVFEKPDLSRHVILPGDIFWSAPSKGTTPSGSRYRSSDSELVNRKRSKSIIVQRNMKIYDRF